VNVRPIAITKPLPGAIPGLDEKASAEDIIVYCARVSNPANQSNHETGDRLLRFCIRNGHWSVFETVSLTVEIKTSRAIAAQMLRHRSFVFQEFSQRYSTPSSFATHAEMRPRNPGGNRQGSDEVEPLKHPNAVRALVHNHLAASTDLYQRLIDEGVAPECARMILPLATPTTLYMTGSVRSWIHYFEQRTSTHAQKEHRLVAIEVQKHFNALFPTVAKALSEA
jgi:thymidylate synthase (FAD)